MSREKRNELVVMFVSIPLIGSSVPQEDFTKGLLEMLTGKVSIPLIGSSVPQDIIAAIIIIIIICFYPLNRVKCSARKAIDMWNGQELDGFLSP